MREFSSSPHRTLRPGLDAHGVRGRLAVTVVVAGLLGLTGCEVAEAPLPTPVSVPAVPAPAAVAPPDADDGPPRDGIVAPPPARDADDDDDPDEIDDLDDVPGGDGDDDG